MLFKTLASLAVLASAALAAPPKGAAFDHIFMIFLENTVRKLIIPLVVILASGLYFETDAGAILFDQQ